MNKTTRRGFLGLLLAATAWRPRPLSLGRKLWPLKRARRQGWDPADYAGEVRWVSQLDNDGQAIIVAHGRKQAPDSWLSPVKRGEYP